MPGKINTNLENRNRLFLGGSGSGKSYAIKNHPEYKKAKRLIAWDVENEYSDLTHVSTLHGLVAALLNTKPANGLRIGLTCDDTPENFEAFCRIVWEYISADWPTMVIVEEVADVQKPGRASYYWGKLSRRGRKYGATIWPVVQRAAEIDKTVYNQCPFKWVGRLEPEDAKRGATAIGVSVDDIANLKQYHAYLKEPNKPAKMIKPK